MTPRPAVVAFDVVETLFALDPVRDRMEEAGLRAEVMPLRFAGSLRDAFALDVAGTYTPFKEVAQATLRVAMANEGVEATDGKITRVLDAFAELPAHPDVRPAFDRLRDAKVRIVTLTNGSAENTKKLLERAGLAAHVEKTISIDEVKRWKPAAEVYLHAAKSVGVDPSQVALVAAHAGRRIGGMSWRIDIMTSIGRGGARGPSGRCGSDRGARGAGKGAETAGPAALALGSGQRPGSGAGAGRTRAAARRRVPRAGGWCGAGAQVASADSQLG